ncbi:FkbM family methyltransferase [Actinoplanes sp. CA-051413]|uniref:FkbM family methyltransferase n=1 Tax=Actinoplanes sp. CA-051413 TaxID=3239899 RepID=UPI003D96B73C
MLPYTEPAPYFGQWGEDRWLAEHLGVPRTGVFVDVGAGDGIRGSNSLYFEERGWTGLCVDPEPRNEAGLARRRCRVQTCAVASRPGLRTFSMFDVKPSWSGLGKRGAGYTTKNVHCRTLEDLVLEAEIERIDLLSIDVEGDEIDVWSSLDVNRHLPCIVIVEFDDKHPSRTTDRLRQCLGVERYELLHRTPANLIFRGRDALSRRRWPDD